VRSRRAGTLIRERMASEHAPRIPEVTAHLVEAGGKRIRPMLTLAAARLCGYEGEDHRKLAATVEFIHTATLLHDDVVDESRKRRGRPTANLLWDNKSERAGRRLPLRARLPAHGRDAEPARARHPVERRATIAEGEVLQLTAAMNLATTEASTSRSSAARPRRCSRRPARWAASSPGARARDRRAARYGDGLGVAFQMATTCSTGAGPRA
jgi:octaprenyl-diphosphate synthase